MHTERRRIHAALVAGLMVLGLSSAGAAQQGGDGPAAAAADDVVHRGDHTVEAGEVVESVAVVDGELRILGEVRGDALVVGGNLVLGEGGAVLGDAVVAGGEIVHEGGRVRGEMRVVDAAGAREISMPRARAEAREEVAIQERIRAAQREHAVHAVRGKASWFDSVRRGLAGIFKTLALGVVLAGMGAALVFYARTRLENVSDTLRASVLRSGAVGLAATFLIVPAFVLMIVALAISIVGIPLLLVAVPLYPVAAVAAVLCGLLATAHAIGERTAEQVDAGRFRYRNSYAYLFVGLGTLLVPLLAAYLMEMTGFLATVGTLLAVLTWAAIWAAATAGLGAIILSRAGAQRPFVASPDLGPDPLFDEELLTREPHA